MSDNSSDGISDVKPLIEYLDERMVAVLLMSCLLNCFVIVCNLVDVRRGLQSSFGYTNNSTSLFSDNVKYKVVLLCTRHEISIFVE